MQQGQIEAKETGVSCQTLKHPQEDSSMHAIGERHLHVPEIASRQLTRKVGGVICKTDRALLQCHG